MNESKTDRMDWLFARLHLCYGVAWDSLWAGLDLRVVKEDWRRELAHVPDDAVLYAIDYRDPDKPPNVAQFLVLCRRAPERHLPALKRPDKTEEEKARIAEIIAALKRKLALRRAA